MNQFTKNNPRIIVLFLAIAASFIAYFQSGRVWPMIDYAYQMENGYRIFLGQIPYKDFGLVLMPGTYWVIAGLMQLFGLSNAVQMAYTTLIAGLTIPLAYFILSQINKEPLFNLILTFPLIFAGYAIYPFPSYDVNAGFFMVLATAFLLHALSKPKTWKWVFAGILLALPILFKQNTGLVFNLAFLSILLLDSLLSKNKKLSLSNWLYVFGGSLLVYTGFLVWLLAFSDWRSFYFHTFTFANSIRPLSQKVFITLQGYLSVGTLIFYVLFIFSLFFFRKIKTPRRRHVLLFGGVIVFILLIPLITAYVSLPHESLNFYFDKWLYYSLFHWYGVMGVTGAASCYLAFTSKEKSFFYLLLPLVFILVANASFLAQGIVGSTYGIWPFFFFMIALVFRNIQLPSLKYFFTLLALIWSLALGTYIHLNTRLNYIVSDGAPEKASHRLLEGLGTPGPWIPNFEGLLETTEREIPPQDPILTVPGEDPFYVFSGRTPPLPYEQINLYTFPPEAERAIEEAIRLKIKWVIVKDPLQNKIKIPYGYKDLTQLMSTLNRHYNVHRVLPGYVIYLMKED